MSKAKSDKLSISERFSLTVRAYFIIQKHCPGLMQTIIVKALATALQPFATIWFSAQILNEIAGDRNLKTLTVLASLVIVINFVISVIKNRIDILHSEHEASMWCYFDKIFADKQMSMDFSDIEDVNIQKQKTKERENLFNFGNGLAQFVWTINGVIEGATSVITSVFMVITLFTSISNSTVMNSPLWIVAILTVTVLGIFTNSVIFKKNNKLFMTWCEGFSVFNRMVGFFGRFVPQDNDRAKDVRIYRQDIPSDTNIKKVDTIQRCDNYFIKSKINESIASLVIGLNYVVCYTFVALKCFFGAFGVGSIVQYVGALGRFGDGIQKLVFGITDNSVYTIHLKSLFEFLDIPNKKYQGTLPIEKRVFCVDGDNEYEIVFDNVSFKYPNTNTYALKNINLKLNIGKKVAVVGMNGSGKTTMIKLLCRLYDPTQGTILLNGIDIKKYNYDEYMSIFSVVFQDFKLFAFDLAQNVANTSPENFDKKRIEDSLIKAGFGERLDSMPNGIDTYLYKDFDENGVEISGGEAQKIALARALYKNAPFIILDEPTAALDPIAEFEIYSKFNEIVGDKTSIYISHRLASCRFCDDIIVFHNGEIIQRGSHGDLLLNTSGKYHELWDAQAKYYKI